MICKKCGSDNVTVQKVEVIGRRKRGLVYWLLFGWVWDILLFIFLTIPFILMKLLFPKRAKKKMVTMAVCQNCGYSRKVKKGILGR